MKKLLLLLIVCISPLVMNAQYSDYSVKGSLVLPETEKYLLLKFDFSETIFEKKCNETDWAILNGKEEWEAAKQEALESIVTWMNEDLTKSRIIMVLESMAAKENSGINPNYTLYISPIYCYKNGKNRSKFILKNNQSGEELGYVEISGRGVHFGSLGNMLGEGFEKSAPLVARQIAKKNKIK